VDRNDEGANAEVPLGATAGWTNVAGTRVRWYSWGAESPTMLLVHGGGANSSWWFDTAIAMGRRARGNQRRIVAMDLSGHGDSDRRDTYTVSLWADEIAGVLEELADDAVLVAHSMGGRPAVLLASRTPSRVRELVLLDSVMPTHPREAIPSQSANRTYASVDEAIARFRLDPPSGETRRDSLERIARASIRRSAKGWTWKFDPRVFALPDDELVNAAIASIACRVVIVQASLSPVTRLDSVATFSRLLGRDVDHRVIATASHHFMVDQPEQTAELLASILDN
jgi:pimeloyl-ACP methyl ester carboxylesterase